MIECRKLLERALTELQDCNLEDVTLVNDIIDYLDTAPVDEVYAHYDANGRLTPDPDKICSTLLVRKIS